MPSVLHPYQPVFWARQFLWKAFSHTVPTAQHNIYRYVSLIRTGREYEKCPVSCEFWLVGVQFRQRVGIHRPKMLWVTAGSKSWMSEISRHTCKQQNTLAGSWESNSIYFILKIKTPQQIDCHLHTILSQESSDSEFDALCITHQSVTLHRFCTEFDICCFSFFSVSHTSIHSCLPQLVKFSTIC